MDAAQRDDLGRIAALADPVRRALYDFVAAQHAPVSRDEAAQGVQVARHVAKFHLDRLAADGLLVTDYRRPPGRSGPGAGRPAKLYRRPADEFAVSLPERRYDLAARLLADAVADASESGRPVRTALLEVARRTGHELADATRVRLGRRTSAAAVVGAACATLAAEGYEPQDERDCITLHNCPFHSIAQRHTDLVCGMNLDLVTGLVEGLGSPALQAQLDPGPDRCCVTLTHRRATMDR